MNNINGQKVLVTGGTGSVAKAVIKKLVAMEPHEPALIRVFSRDESKQHDMICSGEFGNQYVKVEYVIGDVRDPQSVKEAVRDTDVIFHCAAMKHVPACEDNVREACLTNVIGAMNVAEAAVEQEHVKTVVVCSTDKACSPTTAMGASKLLQERIFLNSSTRRKHIRFMCVRFGNLLESRGSVFHQFYRQKDKGVLTITHPDMTRFVSTLEHAADTLIYAADEGRNGDVIVRICPAIKMEKLAMLVAPDCTLKYVGVRKNERIHEFLYNESEAMRVKEKKGHFIINAGREPSSYNDVYSSERWCLNDEKTKELVKDFAQRCGYEI